jgi:DNA repair protein RadC
MNLVKDAEGFYSPLPADIKSLIQMIFPGMGARKLANIAEVIESKSSGLSPSVASLTMDDFSFLLDGEAAQVLAVIRLGSKISGPRPARYSKIIDSPEASYAIFRELLLGRNAEAFAVAYLNIKNEILAREVIAIGSLSQVVVPVGEILRKSLLKGAARIIVAHNHPSQSLEPSSADVRLTIELIKAAAIVGIKLLDHLICSDYEFLSLRSQELEIPWSQGE